MNRAIAALALILAFGAEGARAASDCDHQVYPTTVCLAWEPITGDPVSDKCEVAKLDEAKMQSEFDPKRQHTVADIPLPPHEAMMQMLAAAEARVTSECGEGQ